MMVPQLRTTSIEDASFIYRVYERTSRALVESWGKRWATTRMLEKSAAEAIDPLTRIVQIDGQDCGTFRIEHRPAEVWLDMLFLLPEFQRRGIGSRLLALAHGAASARGLPVRLQAMRGSPAKAYYERHGYIVLSETEFHVFMEWQPNPSRRPAPND